MGDEEVWREKHGFFDGDYWYQLQGVGERASYVAGYLSCETALRHKRVTRPAESYVSSINRWYGTENEGDLNPARENEKIAYVIQQLLRRQP